MDPSEEDNTDPKPGFFTRFLKIPCMRNSLLNGISGGLGVGLSYFLFTSNVSKATNWGTGGFLLVLYTTWGVCRFKRAKDAEVAEQWQKVQQKNIPNVQLVDPKDV
uniref:Cytochrome c oxidase assembly protein COX20, mitochondrial n=1 Tax=Arion vulgaris TaxID=1028688 RepID=A0A0B7BVM3_9EUPU